jgi:ribose transport system substrate-binding protein
MNYRILENRAFTIRKPGDGRLSGMAEALVKGLFLGLLSLASSTVHGQEWRVGVLYWSKNIPGQVAMRAGLLAEAASINQSARAAGRPTVKLEARVAGDGEAGIENQIHQMRELIESKVDLLIVQPTDNAALAEGLRRANKAHIPVVAYDQYISGGVLAAYRSSDNYQAGYLDGEYIASRFPPGKEIRIVLVEYPHVSSTVERVNGFLDALSEARFHYTVLKSYSAVEPVGGRKAAQDLLRDFPAPGSIDVVFTVNDGGGLEVVNGLAAAGRKEILVATVDGDPASIANIRKGRLTVIDSAQFCGPLGAEAMKAGYDILVGKPTPYHALVPVFPVTRETLGRYPGWHGPIPSVFSKPWKSSVPQWRGTLRVVKP